LPSEREIVAPGMATCWRVACMSRIVPAARAGAAASVLGDTFMDAIAGGDGHKDWVAIARAAARRAGLG